MTSIFSYEKDESEDLFDVLAQPVARRQAFLSPNRARRIIISPGTLAQKVEFLQSAMQAAGLKSSQWPDDESFLRFASDVLMRGLLTRIEALNINDVESDHCVAEDENGAPCVEGVLVFATVQDAVKLRKLMK